MRYGKLITHKFISDLKVANKTVDLLKDRVNNALDQNNIQFSLEIV